MKNLAKITSIVITLLIALPSFTGLTITASAAPPVPNGANKANLNRITPQHTDHTDTTLNSDNYAESFEETVESEYESEESEYEDEEETEKDGNEEGTENFEPSDDTSIKPDAPDYPKIPENYKNYNQPPYGNTPLGLTPSTSPALTPSLSTCPTPISIVPSICDTQNEFYNNNNNPQSNIIPISPAQAPPFNFTPPQFPQTTLLLPPNYHPNNTSGTASNNVPPTHTMPSTPTSASSRASSLNSQPLSPLQPTLFFPPTCSSRSEVFSNPMPPTPMFPSPLSSSSLSSSPLTTLEYNQEESNLYFSTLSTQHQNTSAVSNFEHPQAHNNPLLINYRNNINNQNTMQYNNPCLINYRSNINNHQNTLITDNMVGSDDDDDDEQEETMSVFSTYSNSPQDSPAVHGLNSLHSEDNSFITDNININNQNIAANDYENHFHFPTPPTVLNNEQLESNHGAPEYFIPPQSTTAAHGLNIPLHVPTPPTVPNNEQMENNPGVPEYFTPHQNTSSSPSLSPSSLSPLPSMVPISRSSFSTTSPLTTIGNNNQEDVHHFPAHSNSNQNTRTSDNDTNSENHSPTQNKI